MSDGGAKKAEGEDEAKREAAEAAEEEATDAQGEKVVLDYDKETGRGEICVKVICLGDSAVGKSK